MPEANRSDFASEEAHEEAYEQLTLRAMQALAPIADRWGFRIMREVFAGVHRFGQLQRNLGISRNILAERLTTLVEADLLRKVRYRSDPDWYEYRLTKRTADFFPTIVAFYQWVYFYFREEKGEDQFPQFCDCGVPGSPMMICSGCGEPIRIDPDAVVRQLPEEKGVEFSPSGAEGKGSIALQTNGRRRNGRGTSRATR